MVKIVSYGSLPADNKRRSAASFVGLAGLALLTVAAIALVGQTTRKTELFEYAHIGAHSDDYGGTTDPATLNDDQVKGIWADANHAWEGIDEILPTEQQDAWADENDPAVGYPFSNKGSTTSPDGYTGYYDTSLRDGTDVFPNEDAGTGVNDILGYDPILNGGNALWDRKGGNTVEEPQEWSHVRDGAPDGDLVAPMTVADMSDSDWVPYGYTQGGPSHSSVAQD